MTKTSLTKDYKLSLQFAQFVFRRNFLEGIEWVLDQGKVIMEYLAIQGNFP